MLKHVPEEETSVPRTYFASGLCKTPQALRDREGLEGPDPRGSVARSIPCGLAATESRNGRVGKSMELANASFITGISFLFGNIKNTYNTARIRQLKTEGNVLGAWCIFRLRSGKDWLPHDFSIRIKRFPLTITFPRCGPTSSLVAT
jgi:hypothetical protein